MSFSSSPPAKHRRLCSAPPDPLPERAAKACHEVDIPENSGKESPISSVSMVSGKESSISSNSNKRSREEVETTAMEERKRFFDGNVRVLMGIVANIKVKPAEIPPPGSVQNPDRVFLDLARGAKMIRERMNGTYTTPEGDVVTFDPKTGCVKDVCVAPHPIYAAIKRQEQWFANSSDFEEVDFNELEDDDGL